MKSLAQYHNPFVNGSSPSDTGYWMLAEGVRYEPLPWPRVLPTIQCHYCSRPYRVDLAPALCEGCGAPLGVEDVVQRNLALPSAIITLPRLCEPSLKEDVAVNLLCTLLAVGFLALTLWAIFLR